MNDRDRSQWIDNDEGLYNWWRSTYVGYKAMPKQTFIRKHRKEIDRVIDNVVSGRKPAHYLACAVLPDHLRLRPTSPIEPSV